MSLADDLAGQAQQENVLKAQRERERADLARRDAEATAKEALAALERVERELALLAGLADKIGSEPPTWLSSPSKSGKKHRGTPWLLLSDLHLDEVVQPAELRGMNAYNRKIAEQRLRNTFESTVKITRDYWTGLNYDGIVVALAGDLFSGDIHDELTQTNEDTMLGSILHWHDYLAAGISLLADEFGKVHVPVVVGNHSRRTRKPRAKFRARDNFDWFLGHLLARQFAGDKRVTFDVSESADTIVPAYDRSVMVTHGDQASGGAGIGGIWPPIMRLDARKRQRQAAVSQPYDLMVLGHWHTLTFGPNWIVNGSLKGYDEYAFTSNFGFEEPAQALWLMTPEHGKTWTCPILPMNRSKEAW